MEHIALTDIGNYRQKNEDSLDADPPLFIVADGMGGHKAGEVASSQAVKVFKDSFYASLKNISQPEPIQLEDIMSRSMQDANKSVHELSLTEDSYSGMGTTLTACYILDNKALVCHVGDSRLYFKRGNEFLLKTHDHTLVGELYREGRIDSEQAFNHPKKNILSQVIGMEAAPQPQKLAIDLEPGDLLMLCTDGLNSMLRDQEIGDLMDRYQDINQLGPNLLKYAKDKGGYDNITVILIKYE